MSESCGFRGTATPPARRIARNELLMIQAMVKDAIGSGMDKDDAKTALQKFYRIEEDDADLIIKRAG